MPGIVRSFGEAEMKTAALDLQGIRESDVR
jgi:hypothetical protein